MNISDVEKLVGLIENTKDEEVKCMLRKLLATLIAKEGALTRPPSTDPYMTY